MIKEGNLYNMKYANFIVGNLLNLLGIKNWILSIWSLLINSDDIFCLHRPAIPEIVRYSSAEQTRPLIGVGGVGVLDTLSFADRGED